MKGTQKGAAVTAGPQQVSRTQAITSGMHAKGMHKTCSHNSPGNGTGMDAKKIPHVNATDFWKGKD